MLSPHIFVCSSVLTAVNSEIIAMFLLLLKMRVSYNCNYLNLKFEFIFNNANIKIAFYSKMTKIAIINARNNF